MSLADLIRGKRKPVEVATATPATVATPEQAGGVTVASVATVTVAKPPVDDALPAKPAPRASGLWMDAGQEAAIRAWLAAIGETDPEVIQHVLAQCAQNPDLRKYLFSLTDDRAIPDNRRTCLQCARLVRGRCMAAANSATALAREYRPDPGIPRRCEDYEPGPLDTDCRPVPIRWPGLALPRGALESRHD
jgi:hypothetical protein